MDELYHYGVLGMKWGVRRYQNKDGSLTAKGKKRYSSDASKSDKKEDAKPKKKSVSEMSDEELTKAIKRLEIEKRYRDLTKESRQSEISKGRAFANRVIEKIGENTLTNLGTQVANHVIGNAINSLFNVSSSDATNRIVNPQKGQTDKK